MAVYRTGENLLVIDLDLPCPYDDKSSEIFWWAAVTTALFPLGIPLFFYFILTVAGVPKLARIKEEEAIFSGLLVSPLRAYAYLPRRAGTDAALYTVVPGAVPEVLGALFIRADRIPHPEPAGSDSVQLRYLPTRGPVLTEMRPLPNG